MSPSCRPHTPATAQTPSEIRWDLPRGLSPRAVSFIEEGFSLYLLDSDGVPFHCVDFEPNGFGVSYHAWPALHLTDDIPPINRWHRFHLREWTPKPLELLRLFDGDSLEGCRAYWREWYCPDAPAPAAGEAKQDAA